MTGENPAAKPESETALRLNLTTIIAVLSLCASPVSMYVTLRLVEDRQVRDEQQISETRTEVAGMRKDNQSRDLAVNGLTITLQGMSASLQRIENDVSAVKNGVVNARGRGQ